MGHRKTLTQTRQLAWSLLGWRLHTLQLLPNKEGNMEAPCQEEFLLQSHCSGRDSVPVPRCLLPLTHAWSRTPLHWPPCAFCPLGLALAQLASSSLNPFPQSPLSQGDSVSDSRRHLVGSLFLCMLQPRLQTDSFSSAKTFKSVPGCSGT